jgi:hypothetical protein
MNINKLVEEMNKMEAATGRLDNHWSAKQLVMLKRKLEKGELITMGAFCFKLRGDNMIITQSHEYVLSEEDIAEYEIMETQENGDD